MTKFIKNLLSCSFLIMILSVTQSQAEDARDLKIQQLETLLQTYIEENIQLKKQLEELKSTAANINGTAVESNLNACKTSLSSCSDEELCKIATYEDWYNKNEFHWKRVGPDVKFSNEAKRRKLSCGVPKSNDKSSQQLNEANIGDVCLNNLNNCDPVELCKIASYKVGDKNYWSKNNSHKKYIEAAKRRNISCGVIDLELQAKKEQEEQDRKELEEEMKADEEEARLAAAESEKKRIAKEKAKLAAEAERKRKAAERARETTNALLFDRLMDGAYARVLRPAINKNQISFCSEYYKWDPKYKTILMEHYNNTAITTTVAGIMGVVYKEEYYSQAIQYEDYWEVTSPTGLVTKIKVLGPSEVALFGQYCSYGSSSDCSPSISAGNFNTFAVCIFDRYPNENDSVFYD